MPAGGLGSATTASASAAIFASYHDSTIADEHRDAGIRFTPTMKAVVSTSRRASMADRSIAPNYRWFPANEDAANEYLSIMTLEGL